MKKPLADTREEYGKSGLRRADLLADPLDFFRLWYEYASDQEDIDTNAFVLSTVDASGNPDSRVLLLKGIEQQRLIFYTNYNSTKGTQIAQNQHVSMLFFWKSLERQVRIRGRAERISAERSAAYFGSRPRASQLGACASEQSHVVGSRDELEQQYHDLESKYQGSEIPMPENWGGYQIEPSEFEFWQGRESRLHDRFRYRREGTTWKIDRLAP